MPQLPKGYALDQPSASGLPKGYKLDESKTDQDPLESMIKSDFIKSRPKEEARRLLKARSRKFSSMSLDEQDKLLAGLPGAPEGTKSPVSQKLETGAKRFALGMVDLPGAVKEAAVKQPTEQEVGRHRRHPNLFAEPQRGAGLFLDRLLLDPQISEYQKAQKTEGLEKAGHMGAAIVPFYGPVAGHFGESLGKGEFLESVGEAGAAYLASFIFKGMTKEVEPFKRMATAAGGKAKDFEVIAPDLAASAKKFGRPTTVGQLQDIVIRTGKDLESEFNLRLQPFAGDQRMPSEVAQALLDKANSSHLAQTPEGRATRNLLRQKALDYQKPWTLGELNKQRMDMYNARLEAKTQTGQMAAVRSSAETMANKIIEDKLRDIVYDDLHQRYGGAIDFRKMKEKQSRILDVMDRMEKQVETLADAQAELQSAGLTEKLGLSLSGHFGGVTPRVHGLLKTLKGGPQKVADVQVRKAFPATLGDLKPKVKEVPVITKEVSLPSLPLDNSRTALSKYSSSLYHETNMAEAAKFFREGPIEDMTQDDIYFSNNPDLALGQGANQGILIEIDPKGIRGRVNTSKPAWEYSYAQGNAEFVAKLNPQREYQELKSVTVKPNATAPTVERRRFNNLLENRVNNKGWTRTSNPDGSVTYRPPQAKGKTSLDYSGTKAGAKDLASQGARHMTRQAIRNLPLASFFEEEKPDKKPVDKK